MTSNKMTDQVMISRVQDSMYRQCKKRGYAAPVDVLMDIGVLQKSKYEDWRVGRATFLESVCTVNLKKLSFIMRQIRVYAQKNQLKPSETYYKQWGTKKKNGQGHKSVKRLQFSKSGKAEIEKAYATHYLDEKRIAELKMEGQSL